jgi:hypothetical protein
MLEILVLASILGCIPGAIAQRKGRSFVGWWIFGTLLFVVALPASLIVGKQRSALNWNPEPPSAPKPPPADDSDLAGNRLFAQNRGLAFLSGGIVGAMLFLVATGFFSAPSISDKKALGVTNSAIPANVVTDRAVAANTVTITPVAGSAIAHIDSTKRRPADAASSSRQK